MNALMQQALRSSLAIWRFKEDRSCWLVPPVQLAVASRRSLGHRTMASAARKVEYMCTECGSTALRHFGRCSNCQSWNTCKEVPTDLARASGGRPVQLGGGSAGMHAAKRHKGAWLQGQDRVANLSKLRTSISKQSQVMALKGDMGHEIGRVLGGGVRSGSLVLVGGGPGLGKSTLLLQMAGLMGLAAPWTAPADSPLGRVGDRVLYITGEESEDQVADRAERLQVEDGGNVDVLCENDMEVILERIHECKPKAVILDSIQTVSLSDVSGANGSVSQVRECARSLVSVCKQTLHIPVFLVGHITKGGDIAGPKTLEHIVDTVLYLDGEEESACRLLRATKNRFGSTEEVGLFEMTSTGMKPLTEPSKFLAHRRTGGSGAANATAIVLEGNRPIFFEIQALCSPVFKDNPPRRMVTGGLDWGRFDQVLAVLIKLGKLKLYDQDVRANVVGGLPARDPAVDAAMAAAVVSSFLDLPLPVDMAFLGEVDLGGELRMVKMLEKRVSEAIKLGFTQIVIPKCPPGTLSKTARGHVIECTNIKELIDILRRGPV